MENKNYSRIQTNSFCEVKQKARLRIEFKAKKFLWGSFNRFNSKIFCFFVIFQVSAHFSQALSPQSLVIDTVVNHVTCFGSNNGSIQLSVSGGTGPYTFSWTNDSLASGSVVLTPVKDNSLFSNDVNNSNGGGEHLLAGRTGLGHSTRALMAFDIENQLPSSAIITTATLRMYVSLTSGSTGQQNMFLHRVTSDWGEGTSDAGPQAGLGAPATIGDATWAYNFYSSSSWTNPGGDFLSSSAAAIVWNPGFYFWSSAGMVADIQYWLNNPANDFGWLLKGTESAPLQAKRFDSRENITPGNRPALMIQYNYHPVISISQNLINLSPGNYTVTVSDAVGQSEVLTFTITQPSALAMSLNTESDTCQNGVGDAMALVSGGTIPYTYHWSNNQTGATAVQLIANTYSVTVTDAAGCTRSGFAIVNNLFSDSQSSDTVETCGSYNWNGNSYTSSGIYTYSTVNASGCDSLATLVLTINNISPEASIVAIGNQFSFCPNSMVILEAHPTGSGNTFLWSNGATTPTISVGMIGTYSVIVLSSSGCSSTSLPVNVTLRHLISDFDQNGITNVSDFLSIVSLFNLTCSGCVEDITNDGIINIADFLQFVSEFGLACQ